MTARTGGPGRRGRRGARQARGLVATLGLLLLIPLAARPAAAANGTGATPTASTPPAATAQCPDRTPPTPDHVPVLAHFYIWFSPTSWNRAKADYPAVGRYSSDDATVMAKQIDEAKAAGIEGFIVGWRSTPSLDSRLATLRSVAASKDFKLAITYQAQTFERAPLPVAQVQHDLQQFADTYAADPVFHVLGPKPVVALSGTWNYSEPDIASMTAPVASRLMVLATEKNVAGYERVAPAVQGELYYWSSPDPMSTPRYVQTLTAMANATRAKCGVWIAPVSPGFDARAVGGHSIVARRNGTTLTRSWEGALATVPDAIGIISWNEFSENTYIEPSVAYGSRYLDVVRDLVHAPPPPAKETDSSNAAGIGPTSGAVTGAAVAVGAVLLVTVIALLRRRRRPGDPS
jgi:Glycosyl hydrolase family 71